MDSIFFYECSEIITELKEFKRGQDTTILGKKCFSIITKAYEPKGDERITQKFYFSGEEVIAPNVYDNFKDGFLDKIYEESNSHFLRKEMNLKYVNVTFEAIKIKREKVDLKKFEFPSGHALIKL